MDTTLSYERYRPNYPGLMIDRLVESEILNKEQVVAELGIGTGKFTDLLLKNVKFVYGVEPDLERFNFLKEKFKNIKNIELISEYAEKLSLKDNLVDIVFAAQSFHMFDIEDAKREIYRILKPNGSIALIWYYWDMDYPISSRIRNLFYKYGKSENQKNRIQINDELIEGLFYPNEVVFKQLGNIRQSFSEQNFINSMLTSSYATFITNPKRLNDFTNEAYKIFGEFSENGFVEYSFDLIMYYTKLHSKTN